jgi:hypothetical protein
MNATINVQLSNIILNINQKLTLDKLLCIWLHLVLDNHIVVISSEQNVKRPNLPYASIFINPITSVGTPYFGRAEDDGRVLFDEDIEFMVMLEAYGQSSMQIVSNIHEALLNPDKVQILNSFGIIYVSDEGLKDTSIKIDNQWEHRANIDIRFRSMKQYTYNSGYIDTVVINNNPIS